MCAEMALLHKLSIYLFVMIDVEEMHSNCYENDDTVSKLIHHTCPYFDSISFSCDPRKCREPMAFKDSTFWLSLTLVVTCMIIPLEPLAFYKSNGKFVLINLPKKDESRWQRNYMDGSAVKRVILGLPKMLKSAPVWNNGDEKYSAQLKFHCFMYDPR